MNPTAFTKVRAKQNRTCGNEHCQKKIYKKFLYFQCKNLTEDSKCKFKLCYSCGSNPKIRLEHDITHDANFKGVSNLNKEKNKKPDFPLLDDETWEKLNNATQKLEAIVGDNSLEGATNFKETEIEGEQDIFQYQEDIKTTLQEALLEASMEAAEILASKFKKGGL